MGLEGVPCAGGVLERERVYRVLHGGEFADANFGPLGIICLGFVGWQSFVVAGESGGDFGQLGRDLGRQVLRVLRLGAVPYHPGAFQWPRGG